MTKSYLMRSSIILQQNCMFKVNTTGGSLLDLFMVIICTYCQYVCFISVWRLVESYLMYHFGTPVGMILYVVTYLLIIVMGDIPTYYKHKENYYFASVGASEGVSGIIFTYILLYPWHNLYLFAIVPLPAIVRC